MSNLYYKIKSENIEYKGERYFRFSHDADKVVQVVIHSGHENRKGKNCVFGVYLIHKLTFLSNYFSFYVEPSSKKEFDRNFDKCVKMLK